MKKHLITGFVIAASLFACKNPEREKQMEDISAIRVKLVKTDSLLKNVDGEGAERIATEIKNNNQFIQFNINAIGDTIDFKTALFLSNYQQLLGSFDGVAKNYKNIKIASDSLSKTLDNLEHDINNNSLAKGLTPESCIEQEEEHVNEMYEFTGTLREHFDNAKVIYDSLTPKINVYMKELNQKLADKKAGLPTK